jgi:prepilin-type N-terminal cleavage/methylation domain-containing protein
MRKGLTLIEILVAVSIIAILIGVTVGGYSVMTRNAEKARCQELVKNTEVALTEYFNRNGSWPKVIVTESQGEGVLTAKAAYPISKAAGGSMSLTVNNGRLSGVDRLGVVDHWAMEVIRRKGSSATESDPVGSGGTIKDHTLRFAVDVDGDGIIKEVDVGGEVISIRATAAVWSCGRDGKFEPYSKHSSSDDLYSWDVGQTRNIE